MNSTHHFITAQEMEEFSKQFAKQLKPGDIIHLHGDLGAGKTTFTRAAISALGYTDIIKSPTYTLIETYPLTNGLAHHLDLYRLQGEDDFILSGLESPTQDPLAIIFIEWPEHAAAALATPTYQLHFSIHKNSHSIASQVPLDKII